MDGIMKKIVILITSMLLALSASAQLRTAYFMDGSYFRTDMNPALVPTRGYVALPVISGTGVTMNTNFLSVDNFIYNRDGETVLALDSRVSESEFLDKLPEVGKLSLNTDFNILGIGFTSKGLFWNFGVKARVNGELAMDKDLFRMLKQLGNQTYDVSHTSVDLTAFTEVYLGTCLSLTDWLRVGVRLKGLVGVANLSMSDTNTSVVVSSNEISGMVRSNLRANGIMINPNYAVGSKIDMSQLMDWSLVGQNIKSGGFGIDFGAEARLFKERLRVSAAVTDLGFIKWSGATLATAEHYSYFNYRGVDFDSGETDMDSDSSTIMTKSDGKGYIQRLNCTLNIGAEYNMLNNHIAVGLLSHTEFRQTHAISELTASVNFRLGSGFTTTLSHTFCGRNRPGIYGFALNAHPAGFNFFVGMDYIDSKFAKINNIPVPKAAKSLNFYFGLGFNLGKAPLKAIIN